MTLLPAALLFLTGMAPAPAPLTLTPEESKAVMGGEIVVRENGVDPVIGIAYVSAPPTTVVEEVLNLTARVTEVGLIESLDVYLKEPGKTGARWSVGALGFDATFHVIYEYDMATGWCTFTADTSQENDIATDAGSYQAYAHETGSLMVYRAGVAGSDQAPGWLKEILQSRSLREQMSGIRARAEAR